MQNPFFHVIFRACDAVKAVNKEPRPYNLDKTSLVKICFKSLYASLQQVPHKITVIGDKLSNELLDFFDAYNVDFSNGSYGNDESLRQSIKKALTLPDEYWVYFCEDDYFHKPETFSFINNLIIQKEFVISTAYKRKFPFISSNINKMDLVVFPPDYPDRYLAGDRGRFYNFISSDCHWRQVSNITFTFLIQAKLVKKYKNIFIKSSYGANDEFLSNTLFKGRRFHPKSLCVSPQPGLTTHMHINTMTPLVNWEDLVL